MTIQSGSIRVGTEELRAASKARKAGEAIRIPVAFAVPFATAPAVLLGLTAFTGGGEAFEFAFEADAVTAVGFELVYRGRSSWIDALTISWTAIPA
jgi:hypothetical protein